jgi:hypothetical protein
MPDAKLLVACLKEALGSFRDSELAYLALTSKLERSIVDRLAYQLHLALPATPWVVGREVQIGLRDRADIALLESGLLRMAVEAKAMTSADCLRNDGKRREYPDRLQFDLDRYSGNSADSTEVYSLLLAVHPCSAPPPVAGQVIKYHSLLCTPYRRGLTAERVRSLVEDNLRNFLSFDDLVASAAHDAGTAFDTRVELLWWLWGPFCGPKRTLALT